jgi:acetylornithine aminotransferase
MAGIDRVRGRGLLLGAVLALPAAPDVEAAALRRGLVVNALGSDTIRLAPPLLVSDEEVDEAVEILGDALAEVALGGNE